MFKIYLIYVSLSLSLVPSKTKTHGNKRCPHLSVLCYLLGYLQCQSFVFQHFLNVFLVHPMLLLPWGVHSRTVCGRNSSVILKMWPTHCHLLISITVDSWIVSVPLNKRSLLSAFGAEHTFNLMKTLGNLVWKFT